MSAIQLLDEIELAVVEPGAQRTSHNTANETYRGVVRSDSGLYRAYIKPLTGRQLINELVVSVLARSFSLPVPKGFLVLLTRSDLPGSRVLDQLPQVGEDEFLGFACSDIKHSPLARRIGSAMPASLVTKNAALLQDTLIFDEWVANTDRHYNNILISSRNELFLIDHGHCFTGPNWEIPQLRHEVGYANKLAARLIPGWSETERGDLMSKCFQKAAEYSSVDADTALAQAHVEKLLPASEQAALSNFIKSRVNYLYSIICDRVGRPTLGLVP